VIRQRVVATSVEATVRIPTRKTFQADQLLRDAACARGEQCQPKRTVPRLTYARHTGVVSVSASAYIDSRSHQKCASNVLRRFSRWCVTWLPDRVTERVAIARGAYARVVDVRLDLHKAIADRRAIHRRGRPNLRILPSCVRVVRDRRAYSTNPSPSRSPYFSIHSSARRTCGTGASGMSCRRSFEIGAGQDHEERRRSTLP
jgi:hypothetical protein